MAPGGRSLHVRCATWEQVEVFYTRKLRRGKLLSMRVPFKTELGAAVTLGLELPNGVIIAIDGVVQKASPIEGAEGVGKTWIEVELVGFTDEVIARIKSLAAGAAGGSGTISVGRVPTPSSPAIITSRPVTEPPPAAPPPAPAPPPAEDEPALFQHLTAELRRLRTAAVHDVLGVPRDADVEAVRRGWMALVRRLHPDLVARRNAPAISHLAEELTILANRAYDRLRTALVAEGRATAIGPGLQPPPGWLVGFEDISSTGAGPRATRPPPNRARPASTAAPAAPASASGSGGQSGGGEMFETRARTMLGDGDAANAQEVLAAALCVYPRSRPLRSLYYVASAINALEKGEVMLATSQLETALAHHEQCSEAAAILELVRRHGTAPAPPETINLEMRRLFQ